MTNEHLIIFDSLELKFKMLRIYIMINWKLWLDKAYAEAEKWQEIQQYTNARVKT